MSRSVQGRPGTGGAGDRMSPRERLLAWATGKPVDRLPFVIHWGPWAETARRWKQEGMKDDDQWHSLFGFDPYVEYTGVDFGICPAFQQEVLADEGETVVVRDADGVVKRDRKDGGSIPMFLEYPVRDIADRSEIKAQAPWLWEEGGEQMSCVLSGNYRLPDGTPIQIPEETERLFIDGFLLPVGKRLARMLSAGDKGFSPAVAEVLGSAR